MENSMENAAVKIKKSKHCIALTGAGISVESGIPPFRGKDSLWEKYDPMKYADIAYFLKNPGDVWNVFLREMKELLVSAQPNPAHKGLADLEKMNLLSTIITQNIDGLHQKAGNSDVIEFHGSFASFYCLDCGNRKKAEEINLDEIPPKCEKCNGIFRPDCVFFGEMISRDNLERSNIEASQCDVMLVIGTSALVQPAASIPGIAKGAGACVIEVNPQKTPLTGTVADISLTGNAGDIMTRLVKKTNEI